jgi:hypothetical protein
MPPAGAIASQQTPEEGLGDGPVVSSIADRDALAQRYAGLLVAEFLAEDADIAVADPVGSGKRKLPDQPVMGRGLADIQTYRP